MNAIPLHVIRREEEVEEMESALLVGLEEYMDSVMTLYFTYESRDPNHKKLRDLLAKKTIAQALLNKIKKIEPPPSVKVPTPPLHKKKKDG
jgi:hypothetical protein